MEDKDLNIKKEEDEYLRKLREDIKRACEEGKKKANFNSK